MHIPLTFAATRSPNGPSEFKILVIHEDKVLHPDSPVCQIIDAAYFKTIDGHGILSYTWQDGEIDSILVELHERFGD